MTRYGHSLIYRFTFRYLGVMLLCGGTFGNKVHDVLKKLGDNLGEVVVVVVVVESVRLKHAA